MNAPLTLLPDRLLPSGPACLLIQPGHYVTRAFRSITARHDMSRRLDPGFLARLVAEHRLDEDEAADSLAGPVARRPRRVVEL